MQLFNWINNLAGRNAAFDAAMRFFYVCAVPLLWTALLAVFFFLPARPFRPTPTLPRHPDAPPIAPDESGAGDATDDAARRVVLMAAIVVVAACAGTMAAASYFARVHLGLEILSSRPFVTHWVNVLVVEPNDNSFPCPEAMLASGAATLLWAMLARRGAWKWAAIAPFAAGLLGWTRIYCGSNYPLDVAIGWLLGFSWASLALALGRVSLQWPHRDGGRWKWNRAGQAATSGAAIFVVCLGAALGFKGNAPPSSAVNAARSAALNRASSGVTGIHESTLREGEGAANGEANGETVQSAPQSTHYGRQALAEAHLRRAVAALKLPFALPDFEVAQIRVGESQYRVAGVHFEVPGRGPLERKRITQLAAVLIRSCFHHDATLQNVDVTGVVVREVPPALRLPNGAAHKAIPVFTASVQRRNLTLRGGPRWLSAPNIDAGLWLRARSQLYFDPEILPAPDKTAPQPNLAPTAAPTPAPRATKTAKPKTVVRTLKRQMPKSPPMRPAPIKSWASRYKVRQRKSAPPITGHLKKPSHPHKLRHPKRPARRYPSRRYRKRRWC